MIKITQFPYLVIDSLWGSTLNVLNSGCKNENIKVVLKKGQRTEERNILLLPNERYFFNENDIKGIIGDNSQAFSITILSNDVISFLCGMYLKDMSGIKFFNIMPKANQDGNPETLYNGNGAYFDMSKNENHYKYKASSDNSYLQYLPGCIVDYCASSIYISKPTHPLVIGDCCRLDAQDVAGHPAGTHAGIAVGGGLAFDFNYPRHDGGYTFYRPPNVNTSPIIDVNGLVLSNHFDHERFTLFTDALREFFPSITVRVDNRIKTFLQSIWGIRAFIQGDPNSENGHDNHCHVSLGNKINI